MTVKAQHRVKEPELRDDDRRTPMERLTDLTRRVVGVPKEEVDRRETAWRNRRTTIK